MLCLPAVAIRRNQSPDIQMSTVDGLMPLSLPLKAGPSVVRRIRGCELGSRNRRLLVLPGEPMTSLLHLVRYAIEGLDGGLTKCSHVQSEVAM